MCRRNYTGKTTFSYRQLIIKTFSIINGSDQRLHYCRSDFTGPTLTSPPTKNEFVETQGLKPYHPLCHGRIIGSCPLDPS